MTYRIRVYTASKLKHFQLWRDLRDEWPEVHFVARWPFFHYGNIPDTAAFAPTFWIHDVEDVIGSEVVLIYSGDETDHHRGSLVEAGIAIGRGKSVIVVGENPCYGTWQYHPLCHRVADLDEARLLLKLMACTPESVHAIRD